MSEPQPQSSPSKRRYRLMFYNERKGRVAFSFSLPIWAASLLCVFLLALTALLVIIIMTETPLRNYLPGYLDVTKRAIVVEATMRLDSIEHESKLRAVYLADLMAILKDQRQDSIVAYDSAVVRFSDSIRAASEREAEFVARYEEQERFGLNALQENEKSTAVLFLAPIRGEVERMADVSVEGEASQVHVRIGHETPVLAPLECTVIASDFLLGAGWQVVLQHSGDYVVVLSHLSTSMVGVGQVLKSGSVLGHAGAEAEPADRWVGIRIWHKGKAIDPQNVLQLE